MTPDNVKPIVVAITGNVSAGKSTLAHRLEGYMVRYTDTTILSSDTIRGEEKASGARVFAQMREICMNRIELKCDTILDSTGMSPRYRKLIADLQKDDRCTLIIIRLECDPQDWGEREKIRTDRQPIDKEFYEKSFQKFTEADLTIETGRGRTLDLIFEEVRDYLDHTVYTTRIRPA